MKGTRRMTDLVEYQILIGCKDPHLADEIFNEQELTDWISKYFEKIQMNYSLSFIKGGYYYGNGWYATENTLCISIIGDVEAEVLRITKAFSMFLNQECSLVLKKPLKMKYM